MKIDEVWVRLGFDTGKKSSALDFLQNKALTVEIPLILRLSNKFSTK
jgi:hypothetical protein